MRKTLLNCHVTPVHVHEKYFIVHFWICRDGVLICVCFWVIMHLFWEVFMLVHVALGDFTFELQSLHECTINYLLWILDLWFYLFVIPKSILVVLSWHHGPQNSDRLESPDAHMPSWGQTQRFCLLGSACLLYTSDLFTLYLVSFLKAFLKLFGDFAV